jgi:predicted O-linked N-acetylglucosamine transferase (SPINDLY family)
VVKDIFLNDQSSREALKARFAKHGIAADRVGCMGRTPHKEHLLAFNEVDICLDPFPQNGGVSTWDALHMGVPVVAKLGNSVPSRVAGAILSSLGMHEWVADSAGQYSAIALKFAAAPEELKKLRHALPARIAASASGNAARYTQAVEAAYRAMWEEYCRKGEGAAPAPDRPADIAQSH